VKSPSLLPPYPLFQWYPQSEELKKKNKILSMKCSNSAFNAQGSRLRLLIVVVQVGAVKIYAAAD